MKHCSQRPRESSHISELVNVYSGKITYLPSTICIITYRSLGPAGMNSQSRPFWGKSDCHNVSIHNFCSKEYAGYTSYIYNRDIRVNRRYWSKRTVFKNQLLKSPKYLYKQPRQSTTSEVCNIPLQKNTLKEKCQISQAPQLNKTKWLTSMCYYKSRNKWSSGNQEFTGFGSISEF